MQYQTSSERKLSNFSLALQDLPDKDTKTINIKRRAVILTRKLNNKKQIDNDTK